MELKAGSHIHFMGICGTAMASLAGLLKERGYYITGSDTQAYPPMSIQLEKLGIQIQMGYRAENLKPRPDLVIVGNVIMKKYEEAQALLASDIPYMSLPQAMGHYVIENRQSIVVSGTHGKTTTSSLMAWVAEQVGVGAGFLIGGIPRNFNRSFANPKGDFFIIEGDEYDTAFFDKVPKFIHYKPKHVILTSIEFDHADIYKDLDAVKKAFGMLMERIPEDGHLVYLAEDENIKEILNQTKCRKIYSYGLTDADYTIQKFQEQNGRSHFTVMYKHQELVAIETPLMGEHNLKNALSVIALSHQLGWSLEKVKSALRTFEGVKRRQEIIGEPHGVMLIEDFAHHPTAVRETIKAVQTRYPGRKLFAVFEPRSATSRRKVFQKDYVEAFLHADRVLIAQPYDQSSIDETDRFSASQLIQDIETQGVSALLCRDVNEIVDVLKQEAQKNNIVLLMSNGGFGGIYQRLLSEL